MALYAGNQRVIHIFDRTQAIQKLYYGGRGPDLITATFNQSQTQWDSQTLKPSWFATQIENIFFYSGSYFQGNLQNKYQVVFRSGVSVVPTNFEISGRSYSMVQSRGLTNAYTTAPVLNSADRPSAGSLTKSFKIRLNDGTTLAEDNPLIFENVSPPNITRFAPSTANINLDQSPPATISFTFAVEAETGQVLHAHVNNLTTGGNVGPSFVSQAGQGITGSVPNIPRPNQTTTYRLIATSLGGASHTDTEVRVSQAASLTGLARTNFVPGRAGISGPRYTFSGRVSGTPMPTLTYNFSTGETGSISARHIVPFANAVNTWQYTLVITLNNANARSLTINATNASRTAHETLSNINA